MDPNITEELTPELIRIRTHRPTITDKVVEITAKPMRDDDAVRILLNMIETKLEEHTKLPPGSGDLMCLYVPLGCLEELREATDGEFKLLIRWAPKTMIDEMGATATKPTDNTQPDGLYFGGGDS